MSFTIKPINAFLTKDKDLITKMDPYVYLTIGSRKYKSKPHMSGGKTPFWVDSFEVPALMSPQQLQMKVQLYDKDILIDDFIGEGWFDLSMLLNSPGKTDNQYIDLLCKGKPTGRVLLELTYNAPFQNQPPYMSQPQPQGWKQKANMFIKGYGSKNNYPPNYNTQQPFYNQTNQPSQGVQNPSNTGYGYQNCNQPTMQPQGQNKQNAWNQMPQDQNKQNNWNQMPQDQNKQNNWNQMPQSQNKQNNWNQMPQGQNNPPQSGWNSNQPQWNQNSGW